MAGEYVSRAERRCVPAGSIREFTPTRTARPPRIAAYDGDAHTATRMLNQADRLIENAPDPQELSDGSYWHIPPVLNGHNGFVLHALRDFWQARRTARESPEAMSEAWTRAEWAADHRALAGWEGDAATQRIRELD
ncbi:hypothetical protein SAMN04487820_101313 [Actinopolyspora mzabensis]|uniref:Uncharacterized protein n=1 Tax=Actinopolyspora mzabensis TaxID=995066 RepID=A0A1G8VTD7_ACTMZ|nr:hypothetical protein SAMN04487820_101313 [Actinopolyspora mzabensis]